ncbi:MAG TPA: enoyl-CoA hydratase-related protein [Pseudolysinimonas sp.]|nr:enoyl-CoA hydratase-related protein [Pseudolysinimonas sp.]
MQREISRGSRVRLIADGARWDVVLDAPDRRNALDLAATTELRDALRTVAEQGDAVRVLVLRASGAHFSVGGDLKDFAAHEQDAAEHLAAIVAPLHDAVRLLDAVSCPVVAAAQGIIAGAGVGLAYRGDLVLLADDSVTRLAYTAVGLSPDGGVAELLPRLVGARRATELVFTNAPVPAAVAVTWGMATAAVPAGDLESATDAAVDELLAGVPGALAAAKRLVREAADATLSAHLDAEAAAITALIATPSAQRLIGAFAKR